MITGVGPATVLQVIGHESVLQFTDCTDVAVENLRATAGVGASVSGRVGEQHLLGTVSFFGCTDVTVRDCELTCPDNTGRTQSAFYSVPSAAGANARNRVLGNRIEVGDQQIGVLVISCDEVDVSGNDIRLSPDPPSAPKSILPLVAREVARFMGSAVQILKTAGEVGDSSSQADAAPAAAKRTAKKAAAKKAPAKASSRSVPAARPRAVVTKRVDDAAAAGVPVTRGRIIDLPGGAQIALAGPPQIQNAAAQFGSLSTTKTLARLNPRQGLEKFVRRALQAPDTLALSEANQRFFGGISTSSRSMSQGIVVGGSQADLVRVRGNVIVSAIEGIHVGLSAANGMTASAGDVVISGNVVACSIPFFWGRSRHTIYAGSVNQLSVHDNSASLVRIGGVANDVAAFTPTPVEAVRIYGRVGPWLSVRGLSLTGDFNCGVSVTDTSIIKPRVQLRYVSDVLNSAGAGPALSPNPFPYANDRCVP